MGVMIEMSQRMLQSGIVALVGILIGAIASTVFAPKLCDCEILYVAQDEIMGLEQARVENDKLEDRQLFYGEITTAINLATTLPQGYQTATTQVVYSMSAITGKNVKSISKQVHSLIIQTLESQKASS